jgi:hypothetical protein
MAALSPQLVGISQAASNVALLAIFAFGIVLVVLVPYTLDIVNAHKSWRLSREMKSSYASGSKSCATLNLSHGRVTRSLQRWFARLRGGNDSSLGLTTNARGTQSKRRFRRASDACRA